ncbi:lactadherin-like [Asterias amurensis]|uniref:lactadherin-like n=1 Tax=Asterias amurensis TaxID=7602 RepID=UPI003AB677F2
MITLHDIRRVLALLILMISTCFVANISTVESRKMSSYYGLAPEPDPGHNKYYWVKSAMEKLQRGCPKRALLKTVDTIVCSMDLDEPVGMENGDILDTDLSASTTYAGYVAHTGRLNKQGAWCASGSDLTPWIQVNFNARVYITGVITERSHYAVNYVSTYSVKYGDSTSSLIYVTTSGGSAQIFTGNSYGDAQASNRFSSVLHAQVLRIYPVTWELEKSLCCLRFEVLGCR